MWANPDTLASPQPDAAAAYIARQMFSAQWRPFLAAMASELFSNFLDEEACGFFRQIGDRVGRDQPITRLATLQELEAAINVALADMSWGQASFTLAGNDILITHLAFPDLEPEHPSHASWRRTFKSVLEGLYTQWLHAQGAAPEMRAQSEEGSPARALQFRFGYQA